LKKGFCENDFFVDRKPLFAYEKVSLSSFFDAFSLLMN